MGQTSCPDLLLLARSLTEVYARTASWRCRGFPSSCPRDLLGLRNREIVLESLEVQYDLLLACLEIGYELLYG
jgi:hypothetical protein